MNAYDFVIAELRKNPTAPVESDELFDKGFEAREISEAIYSLIKNGLVKEINIEGVLFIQLAREE